jgi:CrcB protein
MNWLLVTVGGALGTAARYGAYRMWPAIAGGWPVATIVVNLVGSFGIGLMYTYVAAHGASADNARLFWMTGVLGGFTTYSAFALETVLLGFSWTGVAYVLATFIGCLLTAMAGMKTASLMI